MDKRTRVFAAMDKKPVDHVPVGFWYHFEGEQAIGEACVQAHKNYVLSCDLDMVKVMCDGFFTFPLPEDCVTADDWLKLKPLDQNHPFIREQVERARRVVEEVGKEMPVFYNVYAPFSSIRYGAGEDRVMRDIRKNKLAVMRALDAIAQSNALLAELMITEAGCDGVYYCVQGGEIGRFTPQEYREMITPSDLYVLEHANRYSQYNIMHCCGWAGAKNQIELWKDYPVKCVNWAVYVEDLSLEDGRFFFGDKACLGGFQSLHREGKMHEGLLHSGTEEEIKEYTRNLVLSFGKRGYLIGADCTINEHIDYERIRWVVDAARSI